MVIVRKETEDQIDMKIIDQLHNATLNFSKTSIELKKLLFVLVSASIPSLILLSNNKLDLSLFITLYILVVSFWFLDGFTYYYQEKLREKMDKRFETIKKRNEINDTSIITTKTCLVDLDLTLDSKRKGNTKNACLVCVRIFRSAFNWSSVMYIVLIICITIGLICYKYGIIK